MKKGSHGRAESLERERSIEYWKTRVVFGEDGKEIVENHLKSFV